MAKFGSVRYSRAVRDTIWTQVGYYLISNIYTSNIYVSTYLQIQYLHLYPQYREGGAALTALTARNITALGVEWDITACTADWRAR